ncbi:hypothetical protein CTEN210_17131 [Chaetoceros tenuissimus]|uniref:Uncharacterized protein n=1 Tax=Chaetoceros tenuissimus TaxID=426638 RepID=A0AAD3DCW6_9STRA|nr:hypothetical protein CTEN210_17131 [Chaetoceros tenuissimus]
MKSFLRFCVVLSVLFVGAEAFSIGQTALKNEIRRSNKVTSLSAVDPGLTDFVVNAWTSYNQALESDPLLTKSVTAGVILGAADLAGQAIENSISEEDKDIDIARFVRFAFFGFILQAPWNHFYYLLLDAPIFTVLIFYFLGILEGKSTDDVKDQLDRDYKDTMLANWKLWVPATMVNLAFCPPVLRVLFLNCVFFFWSIFLSLKLNNDGEEA